LQHSPDSVPEHGAFAGRQQLPRVPPSAGGAQVAPAVQQSPATPGLHQPVRLLQQVCCAVQLLAAGPAVQQSLANRHLPPRSEHWHVPASQSPLQHWELSVQPMVRRRQQPPPTHSSVPQQGSLPPLEQVDPPGRQQKLELQMPAQHGSLLPQKVVSGWQHCPPAQLPVVHWTPASQLPPAWFWQTPLQVLLQQSLKLVQVVPGWRQAPHWPLPERQRWVPQQLLPLQLAPWARQQVRGPPPSACRVSQLIEQQSRALAQVVLRPWQVA